MKNTVPNLCGNSLNRGGYSLVYQIFTIINNGRISSEGIAGSYIWEVRRCFYVLQ